MILIGAFFGFFASASLDFELEYYISWPVCSMIGLAAVFALCFFGVQASVRLLGVLLALETLMLVAIIVAVFVNVGPGSYPLRSFAPAEIFSGTPGVALAFAALDVPRLRGDRDLLRGGAPTRGRGRSHRDVHGHRGHRPALPRRELVGGRGRWREQPAVAVAAGDPGAMIFAIAGDNLGIWSSHAFNILIMTSLFAVLIAAHNSASRILFALARDGWLPHALSATHRRYRSPHVAALVQISISAAVVLVYAIAGADPFTQLGATFVGMTTLGVISLMVVVSIAVIGYFRKSGHDVGVWTSTIAPAASALLLAITLVLIVDNFGLLTGSDSQVIALLPLTLLVAVGLGFLVASRRRDEPPVELDEVEAPALTAV